jgi:hypothetical protein
MIAVRLVQPHRINGVRQPVGYEIDLPDQLGEWLIAQGVAEATIAVSTGSAVAAPVIAPPAAPQRRSVLRMLPPAVPARFRCCGWK